VGKLHFCFQRTFENSMDKENLGTKLKEHQCVMKYITHAQYEIESTRPEARIGGRRNVIRQDLFLP
jgi:hypothetical protein